MCERFSIKLNENIHIIENCVLFSNEALFYLNDEVNRQNVRYWSQQNLHFVDYSKQQGVHKVMVYCGLWKSHVLGPFFFEDHVNGGTYLAMLKDKLMPQLESLREGILEWFQQDGAPAHFATKVRDWLSGYFSNWTGKRGDMEWAPHSPDIGPLDFFFWGLLKEKVYSTTIRFNTLESISKE